MCVCEGGEGRKGVCEGGGLGRSFVTSLRR